MQVDQFQGICFVAKASKQTIIFSTFRGHVSTLNLIQKLIKEVSCFFYVCFFYSPEHNMVFSSILFLFYFLPTFFLLYFVVPNKYRNIVLLFGSVAFYFWGAPKFAPILIGTTLFDYYLVDALHKSKSRLVRRLLLTISVTITIGILAYFKYANFFVDNLNHLLIDLGFSQVQWTSVLLPIGISFFHFKNSRM